MSQIPVSQDILLQSPSCTLSVSPKGILSFQSGDSEWKNAGSLFILHYYDRQHPRAQVSAVPTHTSHAFGTAGTPSLSAKTILSLSKSNDREALLSAIFENIEITVTIRISLSAEGPGFNLWMEDNDIVENLPRLYRVLSLELLPDYGSAKTGEEGYLVLPNWSGCQTFYNKSYPREVRQTVYSSNDQWENVCNMPVFGIVRKQGTLCGLIAQGDCDAQLTCRVHWEKNQANGIHPTLVYRWQQQDDRISGSREVRYRFASPDDSSGEGYVFCAKTYRDFLFAERGLKTWKEKGVLRPEALDYRDRFFLKIFMAYKDPQADGKGLYHATCTFEETKEILEDCLKRGMKKLAIFLVGWGIDGHDGMPPTRFPIDERIGGESGMRVLVDWCHANDILLGVHDSYGGAYTCSPEFDLKDVIRHRSGEYWESVIWSGGQVHNLCPTVFLEKHVTRDIPAIAALGIHGHHHIDAVGSFMTCFSPDHPLEQRRDFIAKVRKMFEFATEKLGSVSTEYPFGPYFDVVDGFFHSYSMPSPWHLASPIGRYFFDQSIPLLEVALHGSLNLGESIEKLENDALLWLDWGMVPQYEVCKHPSPTFGIPAYDVKADLLEKIYHPYYGKEDLVSRLGNALIDGRWDLAPGFSLTRYSDGTRIWVNRSDKTHDDLPPRQYRIAPISVPLAPPA